LPIYEYRCQEGHQFERWEGFEASIEQMCPHCAGVARRLLSKPTIIFKGSGFYSTDYRKDGTRPVGDEGPSPAVGDEGASPAETKSENTA
jgi:putative FmdB family regulatory protein